MLKQPERRAYLVRGTLAVTVATAIALKECAITHQGVYLTVLAAIIAGGGAAALFMDRTAGRLSPVVAVSPTIDAIKTGIVPTDADAPESGKETP